MASEQIAVIGGGISGLAAAWYAQARFAEASISVWERSDRLGGCIQTRRDDGRLIELGADNFATSIPDAIRLSRELGIDGDLIQPSLEHRFAQVVRGGKLYPIPMGFSLMQPTRVWPILTSPILSWTGKIRILGEYLVPRRREDDDESLRAFVVRRLGREAYDRLVEPIVGGIFTADGTKLSMQAAMPQFVAMEREHGGLIRGYRNALRHAKEDRKPTGDARQASGARYNQFVAPQAGMQSWIDTIVSRLDRVDFHLGQPVVRLHRDEQGWQLEDSLGNFHPAHAVVLALPAHQAAVLVRESVPELASKLDSIQYASSAMVAMVVEREEIAEPHRCFGVIVPTIEKRQSLAISFASEKYPGRVASDETLLRVFLGGATAPEIIHASDDALFEIAWKEVQSLLGLRKEPRCRVVQRWARAMPQYHVGHVKLVQDIEDIVTRFPGLRLAGNGYHGVGIPQCIRSGRLAVESLSLA